MKVIQHPVIQCAECLMVIKVRLNYDDPTIMTYEHPNNDSCPQSLMVVRVRPDIVDVG